MKPVQPTQPKPGLGMMGAGVGFQGNIPNQPSIAAGGMGDPWNTTIIPPTYQEQLREFEKAWRDVNEAATMTLGDLIDTDTVPIEDKINALTEAVKKGEVGWQDYLDGMKTVNAQSQALMDDLLSSVSSTLSAVFKESKAAAIASAVIDTYSGINKALAAYPPPYSYAMAALTAAKGFANVAAIRSTSQSGGASRGPSSGGVSVPPAAPAAVEQSQTLTVRGLDAGALFDAKSVRALAERLIDFQRDGGKVILA
jgi:hypothetical protein